MAGICLTFLPFSLAQEIEKDTIPPTEDINLALEDIILTAEIEEQVDYTEETDNVQDLRRRPLNINIANRETLESVPGLTPLLIGNLQSYLLVNGPISTIEELSNVPGFDEETVSFILPYISLSEVELYDALAVYRINPIDVNDALRVDLKRLPGLTDDLISNLQTYVLKSGPINSIFDLQKVRGMNDTIITQIAPYITFDELDPNDPLIQYRFNPLNVNTALRIELEELPGMTDDLISNLQTYIIEFGKLTSVYELQAVPGFTPFLLSNIRPYITVEEVSAQDLGSGLAHPVGPSLKEVISGLEVEFIQRFVYNLEEAEGFKNDTTVTDSINAEGEVVPGDTIIGPPFVGEPYRLYSRLRLRYSRNFSLAITGENDPGEQFKWDPDNQFYGYDFLSGHIAIQDYGALKNLVIGDYTLQFGQGLVLSRGLGFGKGAEVIKTLKMPAYGVRPYSSVNENQFLRGAAATVALGQVYITGFYSRNRLDASAAAIEDSLISLTEAVSIPTGPISNPSFESVTNLQTSGLHRTESELANRRGLDETLYGGRVEFRNRTIRIGTTHYYQQFNGSLSAPVNDFNLFAFRGEENYLNGIDFDIAFKNTNFFGEVARSQSGGIGVVSGLMSSLSPRIDVAILGRHFSRDFHSLKGYVFAERPTSLQNETGLYIGTQINLNPQWTVSAYYDQFYFPWNNFRQSFPSRGYEYLLQVAYKPYRGSLVYLRYRTDSRERNAPSTAFEDMDTPALQSLIPTLRNQVRLHYETKLDGGFSIKTRAEFSWFEEGDLGTSTGMLIYQDISWKYGFKFRLTGRYAIFDSEDFDARIYAYENDILGFFSIPAYFGVGSRYYVLLNYKLSRNVEFWARFAQSRFPRRRSIGSGLSRIEGDVDSEVKLQIRFKF